ncbi:hypothetical protein K504DRAFT_452480 [Pleomassaria siparia CBS 279.74]|uniref:Uncharacterized protein n=1 Tax=Pleomassaria siparia CBS 279.74 TaxID=1314801 RepID=A0A6G1KIN0_9PLEO|nr:hypothetical protein K504DRAFT_452480 [Pleomassaria siparia CBS 279.74]
MCIYVFAYALACKQDDKHKYFLGSNPCGLRSKDPSHQAVRLDFEEAGYSCGFCLAEDHVDIDSDDVKYYPPTSFKVIKENSVDRIMPRSVERCNKNLSDAGSEGSCSSITAAMCGINLSQKSKPAQAAKEITSEIQHAEKRTTYCYQGTRVRTPSERHPSYQTPTNIVPGLGSYLEGFGEVRRDSVAEGIREVTQPHIDKPSMKELENHRRLVTKQLKDISERIQAAKQISASWVHAPPFQPGKAWKSAMSQTLAAQEDQASQDSRFPAVSPSTVLPSTEAHFHSPTAQTYQDQAARNFGPQCTPLGPTAIGGNAWNVASNYTLTTSTYTPTMPLPLHYGVTLLPATSVIRPPHPPLQAINGFSKPSTQTPIQTDANHTPNPKRDFGPIGKPVSRPLLTPFLKTTLPQTNIHHYGYSTGAGRTNNRNRPPNTPTQPRLAMSLPPTILPLGDLMIKSSGKGGKVKDVEKDKGVETAEN